jgi:hypothetical protein
MTGLIMAALFAITQTPSPIPPKALDNPTATGQTVTKNPKNDKAPSTQPPTSIGPSAADQQHVGSITKSEDTQQAIRVRELPRVSITKDWSDWGIWAFNGLLVLVGAFQLLVLWRQAKIMKAQAEIMAEHAAHLKGLVSAAEDNARAASAAAEAASKNADFSKLNAEATSQNAVAAKASADALINAERAWVIAELVPLCTKFSDGRWYRRIADNWAQLSDEEIMDGYFRMHTLKFTNIGRTPAHILGYQISYSCLGEGVTTLSGEAISKQVSVRTFDRLLGGSSSIVVPEAVDVDSYMAEYIEGIRELKNTAVFHGWVGYQHVFSSEILEEPFCYSFKVSEDSLVRIPQRKSDKQKQAPN